MSPLVFFATLYRVQDDTDTNTITISKAEDRKNLCMLMRKYLLPCNTGEFESHLMWGWGVD